MFSFQDPDRRFLFVSLANCKRNFFPDFEFNEFLRQCFQIGYKTLPLISVTGLIMGLVLTIQSRPVLAISGPYPCFPEWLLYQSSGKWDRLLPH
jgi:phospholipid/cholesterol/gamma-HCH transport system permease protein